MYCLGIESTAHTFGVGIVTEKGKVLSNVKDNFITKKGGMIPNKVAEHHIDVCDRVIQEALDSAKKSIKNIDLVSFSNAPGLGHSLRVGLMAAKTLSVLHKIPLIGVNHCIAHLEIGRLLTKAKDPVLLYASGANTQVIAYEGKRYRIFGETLDMGIGNFIDSFARLLDLGFPGGPKIENLAKAGNKYIELPYTVKGMDVSFGGLYTNLLNKVKQNRYSSEDLCYSVQETIFAMLIEVSERALAHCGKTELLLGGGVACNKRLQKMAKTMCRERDARCFILKNEFNVDNGAMIAWLGLLQYSANTKKITTDLKPYERTDDIEVYWEKNKKNKKR